MLLDSNIFRYYCIIVYMENESFDLPASSLLTKHSSNWANPPLNLSLTDRIRTSDLGISAVPEGNYPITVPRSTNWATVSLCKFNYNGHNGAWTHDPWLIRPMLYQLSYTTISQQATRRGFEPLWVKPNCLVNNRNRPLCQRVSKSSSFFTPRRGIEPRASAWQAEMLPTTPTRMIKKSIPTQARTGDLLRVKQTS